MRSSKTAVRADYKRTRKGFIRSQIGGYQFVVMVGEPGERRQIKTVRGITKRDLQNGYLQQGGKTYQLYVQSEEGGKPKFVLGVWCFLQQGQIFNLPAQEMEKKYRNWKDNPKQNYTITYKGKSWTLSFSSGSIKDFRSSYSLFRYGRQVKIQISLVSISWMPKYILRNLLGTEDAPDLASKISKFYNSQVKYLRKSVQQIEPSILIIDPVTEEEQAKWIQGRQRIQSIRKIPDLALKSHKFQEESYPNHSEAPKEIGTGIFLGRQTLLSVSSAENLSISNSSPKDYTGRCNLVKLTLDQHPIWLATVILPFLAGAKHGTFVASLRESMSLIDSKLEGFSMDSLILVLKLRRGHKNRLKEVITFLKEEANWGRKNARNFEYYPRPDSISEDSHPLWAYFWGENIQLEPSSLGGDLNYRLLQDPHEVTAREGVLEIPINRDKVESNYELLSDAEPNVLFTLARPVMFDLSIKSLD